VRTELFSRADFVSPCTVCEPLRAPETEFSRREMPETDSADSPAIALLSRADALAEPLAELLPILFRDTLVLPDLL
jgi:hypothetical protein